MPDSTPTDINIQILPDWAKESAAPTGQFLNYVPRESSSPRSRRNEGASERRSRGPRDNQGKSDRDRRKPRDSQRRGARPQQESRPTERPPQADLLVTFLPEENALEAVTEQLQAAPRAYPIFGLARMFLEKPERQNVRFQLKDSSPAALLLQCTLCKRLALNEADLTAHIFNHHKADLYTEERTQVEAPKGNFTSVAQCRLNGKFLGPTNHHEYLTQLMHMYKTEFSRMPFDRFKESIVSIRDPEVVKKWQEQASRKCTYKVKDDPEAKPLTATELERHFKTHLLEKIAIKTREIVVSGEASRGIESQSINLQLRATWDTENRYPGNLSRILREHFFKNGLHVFKGQKGMQFVTSVRPKPLVANPVDLSKNVLAILDHIQKNPRSTRLTMIEALQKTLSSLPEAPAAEKIAASLLHDLHWLESQGHVIEYNNGLLEIARPPKESKPAKDPKSELPKEKPEKIPEETIEEIEPGQTSSAESEVEQKPE